MLIPAGRDTATVPVQPYLAEDGITQEDLDAIEGEVYQEAVVQMKSK